jgi:hypothetical protein
VDALGAASAVKSLAESSVDGDRDMDAPAGRPPGEEAKETVRLCRAGRLYDVEKALVDGKALDVQVGKN